ncbi:hypothetical protein HYC85_021029 [Camellia sinensis]|uniref:Uncharacterized protein n=1 Tax=Camellia sinensis TaxID=4442 RepID=A0A7J7GGH2_CAMSI|nr:hypothetical protein HYC85_021029 [Camellia sinensis]
MSFRQKTVSTGNKLCRPSIKCADRQTKVPIETKGQPVASSYCRWCVGMPHKAFPTLSRQETSVWCKTRHLTVEFGDPEARRVAETSGNSKRTQTWMITECSNVVRVVTPPPLFPIPAQKIPNLKPKNPQSLLTHPPLSLSLSLSLSRSTASGVGAASSITLSLNYPYSSTHPKPTSSLRSLSFSSTTSHNVFSTGLISMSPVVRPTRHLIICEAAPNKKVDSAAKRACQAEKRRVYNKARKSEVKTRMKKGYFSFEFMFRLLDDNVLNLLLYLKKLNIFLDGLMSTACIVGRRFLILNSSKELGQRRYTSIFFHAFVVGSDN